MTSRAPRGIRNNNPGNIEHTPANAWQGLDTPPSDGRFARFTGPEWGIRAIARVLISYQDRHGIRTIRGFINRWAPPSENNTKVYVDQVAKRVGVEPDSMVNVHEYEVAFPLVEAIIRHENGQQPYSKDVIDHGLRLAGVEPPRKPLVQSRTATGAAVAAGAGVAALVEPMAEATRAVQSADQHLSSGTIVGIVVGLVIVGAALFTFYARWDDWRKKRL